MGASKEAQNIISHFIWSRSGWHLLVCVLVIIGLPEPVHLCLILPVELVPEDLALLQTPAHMLIQMDKLVYEHQLADIGEALTRLFATIRILVQYRSYINTADSHTLILQLIRNQ